MCNTGGIMTSRKKTTKKPTNGGRATIRDVLSVVQGLNERIDGTSERIDQTLAGQQEMSRQMVALHTSMHDLRRATNERLHDLEADIITLRRPWTLMAGGWRKAVGVGDVAAAVSGVIVRLELWRFIPGL